MNATQIELVKHSFDKTLPSSETALQIFGNELSRIDPGIGKTFNEELRHQQQAFVDALGLVVHSLEEPQRCTAILKNLAAAQNALDTRPIHYAYIGNALLKTLAKLLGPEMTPELWEAWVTTLRSLARLLIENSAAMPLSREAAA